MHCKYEIMDTTGKVKGVQILKIANIKVYNRFNL